MDVIEETVTLMFMCDHNTAEGLQDDLQPLLAAMSLIK